jgi:hypothetical protein
LKALAISQTTAPSPVTLPKNTKSDVLVRVPAQLHLFDAVEGVFMLQDEHVIASVIETGPWECMLHPAFRILLTFRLAFHSNIEEDMAITTDGS